MIKAAIQKALNSAGFDIVRMAANYTPQELAVMRQVKGLTATGPGRLAGLMDAVKYIAANKIAGAVVECGVWRGGSVMAALLTLKEIGDTSREVFLYDTFEGMSAPTQQDVMFDGTTANSVLQGAQKQEGVDNYWCYAGVESVRRNILTTGYPAERLRFIKGKVEDTIPTQLPGPIALLRLDTDWYESTRHELQHLYPLLQPGGVLIIDDYGHWQGARQAVDEYFAVQGFAPLLSRLDYTGRMMVKPPAWPPRTPTA
jgi:O-methyltransferase